jgi:hypothetical protein
MSRCYIAPVSWGLGDLIVSLPAVQALIAEGRQTFLVVRSPLQEGVAERIPGLCGAIAEDQLPFDLGDDTYINLRDHPLQRDYWWGGPEFRALYPTLLINDILAIICGHFGLQANFDALLPVRHERRKEIENKVVFVAGSDGDHKCWPAANWLSLSQIVGRENIVLLGQPESSPAVQELIGKGLNWVETRTVQEAIDAVSTARAVVGVDTGLTHIAVQQRVPTITLFRHDPVFFRPYAYSKAVVAPACSPSCEVIKGQPQYHDVVSFRKWTPPVVHCTIDEQQRCMTKITPQAVSEELRKLYQYTSVAGPC